MDGKIRHLANLWNWITSKNFLYFQNNHIKTTKIFSVRSSPDTPILKKIAVRSSPALCSSLLPTNTKALKYINSFSQKKTRQFCKQIKNDRSQHKIKLIAVFPQIDETTGKAKVNISTYKKGWGNACQLTDELPSDFAWEINSASSREY